MKKTLIRFILVLNVLLALFFLIDEKAFLMARAEGYRALKVFYQIKSTEFSSDFKNLETEHFIIKYKASDKRNINEVADIFEKSYHLVGRELNFYPSQKIIVFVYPNQEEFWKYQRSVRGQAVMGLYNFGVIHVLSPGYYDNEFASHEETIQYYEKYGPILHEYVHCAVDDLSGGNVDLWLTEGIALYYEFKLNGAEWAPDYQYDELYTLNNMRFNFVNLDAVKSYRQSLDMVNSLIQHYGEESIKMLLAELKKGNTFDKAFYSAYGDSCKKTENRFLYLFSCIRGDTKLVL